MSAPWIRVHANLSKKKVIGRLMTALDVTKHEAMGLLVELWGNVAQHTERGVVRDLPATLLEDWAGWRGEAGRFAKFVLEHHTTDGVINEWDEYAGRLEERRDNERKRKADGRRAKDAAGSTLRSTLTVSAGQAQDSTQDVLRTGEGNTTDTGAHDNDNDDVTPVVDERGSPSKDDAAIAIRNYAIRLTTAANHGVEKRWGAQANVLVYATALEAAEALIRAGVDASFAESDIARQCSTSGLKAPPSSVKYFKNGILGRWASEVQRRIDAMAPAPVPWAPGTKTDVRRSRTRPSPQTYNYQTSAGDEEESKLCPTP